MHRWLHNLMSLGNTKAQRASRRVCAIIVILTHLMPAPSEAKISAAGALKFPEVMYLVGLIKATNDAMATASLNPQNKNYRENVRRAVSMLPAGIIAVAGVFKAGKLHDSDLPVVQAMLGGFVDVSAPDRYKEFFKKPDASLIPKVGSAFPSNVKPVDIGPAAPTGPAKAEGPAVASIGPAAPLSNDIVSLQERWAPNRTTPSDKKNLKSYGYDEAEGKASVGGGGSLGEVANVGGNGRAAGSGGGIGATNNYGYDEGQKTKEVASGEEGFQKEMKSEFSNAESRVGGSNVSDLSITRVQTAAPSALDREKDNFFAKGKQSNQADDEELIDDNDTRTLKKNFKKRAKSPKRDIARDPRAQVKAKYFFANSVPMVLDFLMPQARAQECQDCGGGGSEGGSKAAEILMAIAAIIAAIAPMIVASIQAEADKAIAKINADTTIKTAQMQSDTSKFLANVQKDVALQQAQISQQITKQNNDAQSQRLNMQLAELRSAREDAKQAEQEKRQIELQYNQERIALAKKQADDNVKLAKQTLNANLTQAGLVSGVTSKNSSNSLTVAKAGLTSTPQSGSATNSALAAQSNSSGGLGGGTALPATGGIPSTGSTGGGDVSGLGFRAASVTTTSRANDRLLSAVAPTLTLSQDEVTKKEEEEKRHSKTGTRKVARNATRSNYTRGFVSAEAQKVTTQLAGNVASGSTAGRGFKIAATEGNNDLADFRKGFSSSKDETWYQPEQPRPAGHSARGIASTGGGHSGGASRGATAGAYRAPDDLN